MKAIPRLAKRAKLPACLLWDGTVMADIKPDSRRWNWLGRRTVILAAVLGLLVTGAVAGPSSSPGKNLLEFSGAGAGPTDWVSYHLTAYDLEGTVLFTTDPDLHASQIAAGNSALDNEVLSTQLGPRSGNLSESFGRALDSNANRFLPSTYLFGHRAGETVWTPYYHRPFGTVPEDHLAKRIGPLATRFDIDLATAYNETRRANAESLYGPLSDLVPGASIQYGGGVPATVLARNATHATLQLQEVDGAILPSLKMGFDMIVESSGGVSYLTPVLEVGQTFDTAGCGLPDATIGPGRYTVVRETDSTWVLQRDLGNLGPLWSQPLRFEIRILEVINQEERTL
jgi:hypothetical protein